MTFVHKIRQVQLVGPKVRQLRKERKLTQAALASRIGIQQSDLSRMEKGEYRVSLDTLFKILAEFNVGIGEFFDDVHRETLSPHDVQLVRRLRKLSPEAKREVEAFVAFKRTQASDGTAASGPRKLERRDGPSSDAASQRSRSL